MKKLLTICALTVLAGHCLAGDAPKYYTDPEARKVADQLIETAKSADPVDRIALLPRAAVIGHPGAMMRQCQYSNAGGPRAMRYDGIAWCRIIESDAPAEMTKLREAAHAQLQSVMPSITAADEISVQQAETNIRSKMARPWQEAEAAAAARATPPAEAISVGSNGAQSSKMAVKMYLDAVRGHDGAALDRVVNPLDMIRLNNNGAYGAWRDAQLRCEVTLKSDPMPPPAMLLQVYRYRKYPLETANIGKKCGVMGGGHPITLATILITIEFKGRWFVTTDSI